jgi:putative DNA primase/helicase
MDSFQEAMNAAGISPPAQIVQDGSLQRFHVEGDKQGSTNGWYVLFADPPAGSFGCWKRDIHETWNGKEYKSFSPDEKAAYRAKMEVAKAQRKAEQARVQEQARRKAQRILSQSRKATDNHPYLLTKGVKPYGLRVENVIRPDGSRLIIPIRDTGGTLHGLQYVSPEGTKRYLTGTAKNGNYFSIGKPDKILFIVEGYATAATIFEAMGEAVAVAFDAGNLKPVAVSLRAKFPSLKFIICGDNDYATDGNPGLRHAREAAQAVNGLCLVPDFGKVAA